MKKISIVLMLTGICFFLCACAKIHRSEERVRDLPFTVLDESAVPENLLSEITKRKAEPFEYIFSDREHMYICIGYGEQKTKGYSVAVDELYLTKDAVYVETTLLGPRTKRIENTEVSYPYIVIKTEYLEQTIVVK